MRNEFPLPECDECPARFDCELVKAHQAGNDVESDDFSIVDNDRDEEDDFYSEPETPAATVQRSPQGMINIVNQFEEQDHTNAADIAIGEAFLGTVSDVNGADQSGVFVRTATGIVLLDDPSVEFDTFDESDGLYAPGVTGYKVAEITVTVDDAY